MNWPAYPEYKRLGHRRGSATSRLTGTSDSSMALSCVAERCRRSRRSCEYCSSRRSSSARCGSADDRRPMRLTSTTSTMSHSRQVTRSEVGCRQPMLSVSQAQSGHRSVRRRPYRAAIHDGLTDFRQRVLDSQYLFRRSVESGEWLHEHCGVGTSSISTTDDHRRSIRMPSRQPTEQRARSSTSLTARPPRSMR